MGDKTGIGWTDTTWNPVTGCDRCSPGCDFCYALTHAARMKLMGAANYQTDGDPATSGPGFGVACHPHMLDRPLRWTKPRRIFVNSMSDLFHPQVPTEFIAEVIAVCAVTERHIFQVLTKRPARMRLLFNDPGFITQVEAAAVRHSTHRGATRGWTAPITWPLPNLWMGVTVDTDDNVWRTDHLRDTPAAIRFVSAEPLLSALPHLSLERIDWLIIGGESGRNARPMHPDWVTDLLDAAANPGYGPCPQCEGSGSIPVPGGGRACDTCYQECSGGTGRQPAAVFFKQWGSWRRCTIDELTDPRIGRWVDRYGNTHGTGAPGRVKMTRVRSPKDAGNLFAGKRIEQFPTVRSGPVPVAGL